MKFFKTNKSDKKENGKEFFFPEEEYKRYIIGQFEEDGFVPDMLKEYGEICVDSPQISEFYNVGDWTVIPCPIELLGRGDFIDLACWMCQDGDDAFAIAVHDDKSYFAGKDESNPSGDTAIVIFDDGECLRWNLPEGLCNDKAYTVIDSDDLDSVDMPQCSCKEFLESIQAVELIEHLGL